MLFSLQWLCSLGPFEPDAERIARTLTDRGLTVDSVEPGPHVGDIVLDVDIPANRPDCLGHLGLARELAAAFAAELYPRESPLSGEGTPTEELVRVEIDDPELCFRYTARIVRGVRVGPSPDWVVQRLETCGLRSVSNVVDASNLVLLEVGHPIHAFDLDRIPDGRAGEPEIRVRRAHDGERLVTLDGIERVLSRHDLVIADHEAAIALAGVMGGASTEIGEATRNGLIEAAWFDPISVRRTARRLGLRTDASHRFERGMDPEGVRAAQDLAVRLLGDLASGRPAPGWVDTRPRSHESRNLEVRPSRVSLVLGYDPGSDEVKRSLHDIGLRPEAAGDDRVRVTVPSWRVDLEREVDLVEEVARHLGYDRIPVRMPATTEPAEGGSTHPLEERSRAFLACLGFLEAFNYAMIARDEDAPFVPAGAPDPLEITNPIAEPLMFLRRSLFAGLLRSVDANLRRGGRDVRLFEVGRVFLARGDQGDLPREPLHAALACTGSGDPPHWSRAPRPVDLGDVAGPVEALVGSLRPGVALVRSPGEIRGLHPGQTVFWTGAGAERALAWAGALHPEIRDRLDLAAEVFLAAIDLDAVAGLPDPGFRHLPIPRVPSVARDLSIVLDDSVTYGLLRDALVAVESPAAAEFEVIDRYEGEQVGAGRSSLTVRVILSPRDRTLTDEAIEAYRSALVTALEAIPGVELRA